MIRGSAQGQIRPGVFAFTSAWYRIENKADQAIARVYIYNHIGFDGVTAQDFVAEIGQLQTSQIELHLNTPGGDVADALAIYNAVKDHPADVTAIVDGEAASAGSFIFQAADTRVMNSFSILMIHDAAIGMTIGNAKDHREVADMLDKYSDNIAAIYASRAGGSADYWRTQLQAETFYTADEALAAGLADEVRIPLNDRTVDLKTSVPAPVPVAEPVEAANPWAAIDFHSLIALTGAQQGKVSG